MVYLLDSPSCTCIGVAMTDMRDVFQSNLESQDEIYVAENAGMVQATELVHQESRVEVECASDCDSETSTLVNSSWRNTQHGGSLVTSDHECEMSALETDDATEAQMLDGDERAWDGQPLLKQKFEGLKAIILAIFSRRAERHR